jgi:hypothetical protein
MQNLSRRTALKGAAAIAATAAIPLSANASIADPVIELIAEWRRVCDESDRHLSDLDRRYDTIPESIRDWPGVHVGTWTSLVEPVGDTPIYERTEARVIEHYGMFNPGKSPEEIADRERKQDKAIAEIRRHRAELNQAYRDAGLPYTPDTSDEYTSVFVDRVWDMAERIEKTPPRTIEGVHAKLKVAASLIDRTHGPYGGGPCNRDKLEIEDRFVMNAVDDLDRLGGAS